MNTADVMIVKAFSTLNDSTAPYPPPLIEYPGYVALLSFCFLAPSAGTSSTCHWNEQNMSGVYLFILVRKKKRQKKRNSLIPSLQLIYFSFIAKSTFCKLNLPLFQALSQSWQ